VSDSTVLVYPLPPGHSFGTARFQRRSATRRTTTGRVDRVGRRRAVQRWWYHRDRRRSSPNRSGRGWRGHSTFHVQQEADPSVPTNATTAFGKCRNIGRGPTAIGDRETFPRVTAYQRARPECGLPIPDPGTREIPGPCSCGRANESPRQSRGFPSSGSRKGCSIGHCLAYIKPRR
jgi:hypothetical protein